MLLILLLTIYILTNVIAAPGPNPQIIFEDSPQLSENAKSRLFSHLRAVNRTLSKKVNVGTSDGINEIEIFGQFTSKPVFRLVFKQNEEIQCPSSGKNLRYDEDVGICAEIGTKSHCAGTNMEFFALDAKIGACDCSPKRANEYVPLVYHPESNNCFYLYTRAYCPRGQWLIFDFDGFPTCVNNPCERTSRNLILMDRAEIRPSSVLWNGRCVPLGQSNGVCPNPREVTFYQDDLSPRCDFPNINTRHLTNIANFKCKPGTRRNVIGKCQRTVRFDF